MRHALRILVRQKIAELRRFTPWSARIKADEVDGARLLLDLAALQDGARPVTVAAEILAAGGAAAAIAAAALGQGAGPGQGLATSLISLGAASAAMAGVARWRVLP